MKTPHDIDPNAFIERLADVLEKEYKLEKPDYINYVKTGCFKERIPEQKNFWYIRCASILRKLYKKPIGVEKLRKEYGGATSHSVKPSRRKKGSGSIIRDALQILEKHGLVEKVIENRRDATGKLIKVCKGRKLTPKCRKLLDSIAKDM